MSDTTGTPNPLPADLDAELAALEAAALDPDADPGEVLAHAGRLVARLSDTDSATRAAADSRLAGLLASLDDERNTRLLRRAYAEGHPVLVGPIADGGGEMWQIGRVMFGVIALRDHYPAVLKAAVQARRDAAFTGSCGCGAQIRIRGGRAHMNHPDNCPASDRYLDVVLAQIGGWPAA